MYGIYANIGGILMVNVTPWYLSLMGFRQDIDISEVSVQGNPFNYY